MPETDEENQEFEREKVAFEQNHRFQSDLLKLATQIILVAITINGGLLLIIGGQADFAPWLGRSLLVAVALVNAAIVHMLKTIEKVMNACLEKIRQFHPESFPSFSREEMPGVYKYSVITVFSILLSFASASFVTLAIINPFE